MAIALHYAARSDVGLIRSNNQDSGYAGPHLLVVADGMGGHAGGDIASSIAVAELASLDGESLGAQEAQSRLNDTLRAANGRLLDRVVTEPVLAGMGTTVTAVLRSGNRLILAHIGDSRAYLLRGDELVQVTSDHTYVQRLVEEGSLTPDEADHHPQRSVLLRVLTGEHGDEPDLSVREGRPGDRLMLCSDGLSGVVSFDTIRETLGQRDDPGTTADQLVRYAMRAGGPDNITVIVADVVDGGAPPTSTTPQVVGAAAAATTGDAATVVIGAAGRAAGLLQRGGDAEADRVVEPVARKRRGPGLAWWLVVLVVALGLGGGVVAAWQWSQDQFYVGVHADGGQDVVAIYRGLPQDVAGLELSSLSVVTDIAVDDLPAFSRQRLDESIVVDDVDQAEAVVEDLRQQLTAAPTDDGTPTATSATPPPATSQDGP